MSQKQKNLEQYRELAQSYVDKHKCRWSEACLEIKRRHPEARLAFGAPPKKTQS